MIAELLLAQEFGRAQRLLRKNAEEAFDLVEPGCAGGGKVEDEARVPLEPCADFWGFVRGVIVHDQMDHQFGGHLLIDALEELDELLMPVLAMALGDDFAGGHIERRE